MPFQSDECANLRLVIHIFERAVTLERGLQFVFSNSSRRFCFHCVLLLLSMAPSTFCKTLRVFTNGIIWWSQERFVGYWYATDVIMVCKHLRTTFRALCLELLPLWMWGGKEGEEPTPDPVPTTEEEWEAEVGVTWQRHQNVSLQWRARFFSALASTFKPCPCRQRCRLWFPLPYFADPLLVAYEVPRTYRRRQAFFVV